MENKSKKITGNPFEGIIPGVETAFKVCYLVHLLMAFNAYFAGEKVMNVTLVIVTALGLLLGCYRLIYCKRYLSFPNLIVLIGFIISYALTAVVNIHYGLYESAQYFVWLLFQFGLLYAFDWACDRKKVRREFHTLAFILITIITVYNIIGLGMMIKNYYIFHEAADGQVHLVGMAFWGRLHGLHADPNYGSVTSGVALILAVYYMIKVNKVWKKGILLLTAVIQFLYIIFSVSRTGLVSLTIGLAVFLAFYTWKKAKRHPLLTAFLVAFITVAATTVVSDGVLDGYNKIMQTDTTKPHKDPSQSSEETRVAVNRQEELDSDISNRRFDIWQSAIQIFISKPITGVGFRNIVPYAKENLPNTYIVNNDMGDFDAMHNMIMDVLASQGLIGILLFFVFAIGTIIFLIKNFKYIWEEHVLIDAALFSCCLSIGISSMFISHILYVNNPNTYLFWACLGYLIYSIKKDKEENKKISEALQ